METYLVHHGIMGQKWGVRRFQNDDGSYTPAGIERYKRNIDRKYARAERRYRNGGSYTQAGLKRYRKSLEAYEESKVTDRYVRQKYKDNPEESWRLKSSEKELREAKKQMQKDYKHLKQDKLGDQGKELYREGHTITGGNFGLTYKVGAVAMATALTKVMVQQSSLASTTLVNKLGAFNVADLAAGAVGAAGTAAIVGMRAHQWNRDRKLRAYYGHTSKY